jgi:membrane protease YdiL (CAAX protease family)
MTGRCRNTPGLRCSPPRWRPILTFVIGLGALAIIPVMPVPGLLYFRLSAMLQLPMLTAWFLIVEVYTDLGLAFGYWWIRYVEQRPLSSVGFVKPSINDVLIGLLVFLCIEILVGIVLNSPVRAAADSDVQNASYQTAVLAKQPIGLLVLGCITSPVLEELTLRGYAISRLEEFGVWTLAATAFSVALGTISHIPFWGSQDLVAFAVGELLFALLFVWRRNLFASIIAHVLTNLYAGLIWPAAPHAYQSAIAQLFGRL